jgi:ABC-2 type transport system permease protein
MNVVYALWLRELKHYYRAPAQIASGVGQPVLYILSLGFGFAPVFSAAGGGSYMQFLAPGMIGMTVLFLGTFAGIGILWDRQFGFLKETLVSPVPRIYIMLGRTLGGATIAVIQGLMVLGICMIAGFRPQSAAAIGTTLFFMTLIAVLFCALGTAIGCFIQDVQSFPAAVNFVIMPIFLFSRALFPFEHLSARMRAVISLNPLSYGVDSLRGALIGASYFGLSADLALLLLTATAFVVLGALSFSRVQL